MRRRVCNHPAPLYDGEQCEGDSFDSVTCFVKHCRKNINSFPFFTKRKLCAAFKYSIISSADFIEVPYVCLLLLNFETLSILIGETLD